MKTTFRICYFSFNRSELGLMKNLLKDFDNDKRFELKTIIGGSHLNKNFGNTRLEIKNLKISDVTFLKKYVRETNKQAIFKFLNDSNQEISNILSRIKPHIILLMGDRYELLSFLNSSILFDFPIAHISGGEITEGAIDNQIRNILTKTSHLHFVANQNFKKRVLQMGEEKWRVVVSGEPGLEKIQKIKKIKKDNLEKILGLSLSNTIIVTYHPTTYNIENDMKILKNILKSLNKFNFKVIFTSSNADEGGDYINRFIDDYVKKNSNTIFFKSLGFDLYHNVLSHVKMMIGNSSSGIVEAASYNLPVVNIGDRQKGRPFTKNVFHSNGSFIQNLDNIKKALEYDKKVKNIYFKKNSSNIIRDKIYFSLLNNTKKKILSKKFIDI